MSKEETIVRFENVSHELGARKTILDEVNFSVRRNTKITLMGQNGAGKSTIFKLIIGDEKPESGAIHISPRLTIATARQVIPRSEMELTIREFFQKMFNEKIYDIDPRIDRVLDVVNLHAPHDRIVGSFSGGQQARILLASALIQDPDLLLLDEPTNNLDKAGIEHLTKFLIEYDKTCIVISHDAAFLNSFTQGVLYLDVHKHKVEQYMGNYSDVLKDITARVEKENMKNAQFEKNIIANKEKASFFANKGGKMRLVAKKMRLAAEEMEESKVNVRREDKTIRAFTIPVQENLLGEILKITSYTTLKSNSSGSPAAGKPKIHKKTIVLKKNQHLLLMGPNGIGKSTLLESIANKTSKGVEIGNDVVVGYYRQDFANLNFEATVFEELISVMKEPFEGKMRSMASGFLITEDIIHTKIGHLSEGQKGLVAFASLALLHPGLLILDEPTNHMNFRHLPVIAAALDAYRGAMILVSHVPEFVSKIRIDEKLDLAK